MMMLEIAAANTTHINRENYTLSMTMLKRLDFPSPEVIAHASNKVCEGAPTGDAV